MAFKRKDPGRAYSPARKALSRSLVNGCRSPRRGLSTSFQASTKPVPTARPGARPGTFVKGSSANMKVVVRVRPLSLREKDNNARVILDVVDDKMIVFDPKREEESFFFHGAKQRGRDMLKKENKHTQYLFDRVFGTEANNEDVFEGSTKSIVSSVLDGFNCSVFVYGATGAGKTFTMLGTVENPGITFRTMAHLFDQMNVQQHEKDFEIGVSYLEVYNENVRDLLNPMSSPLHLREDVGGVMVAGLKVEMISDPNRMFELLEYGNKNRTQHPTDANAESSRSHAVFQVFIKMKTKINGQTKMVKLSMIDLAGSERGAATGCAGARFKEGSNINKSLLALGNCINALADGLRHVPYRDSKLTRLLKDSLGGNCQTVMIANVAPAHYTYEDTHNTLKYATRAKTIKFQIKKNIVSVELHVSHYIKMVEDLKTENEHLKKELELLKGKVQAEDSVLPEAPLPHLPPLVAAAVAAINTKTKPTVDLSSVAVNTSPLKEQIHQREDFRKLKEEAEKLYNEKARIHHRYLTMDSSDKVLRWRIKMKQRTIDRVQSMSSTPARVDQTQNKVDKSVGQFMGRLHSANECQEAVSVEETQINERLEELQTKLREQGIYEEIAPHLNAFELQFLNQELSLKCQHLEKLVEYLDTAFETHDEMLITVGALFRKYYNLVRGFGHMNEELKEEHEAVMRGLEGLKAVRWASRSPQIFQSPVEPSTTKRPCRPSLYVELNPGEDNASKSSKSINDQDRPGSSEPPKEKQSDKADLLQSPLCSSSSNVVTVSQNMDTAAMLDSLEVLDTKVEGLLNTSVSSMTDQVGCEGNLYPHLDEKKKDLNTTYNNDLNSTFIREDPSAVPIDLNVTFEKPKDSNGALLEAPIGENLNGTFSLEESTSPKTAPSATGSAEKSTQNSLASSSNTGALRKVQTTISPSVALQSAQFKKPTASPLSSSLSIPPLKKQCTSSSSPIKIGVPSCVSTKPVVSLRRAVGGAAVDKRKALSSNLLPMKPPSNKIGINRKFAAPSSKLLLNTPSKVKLAWNKENRNVNTVTSTKVPLHKVPTAGGKVKKTSPPVPLNDTFTKDSPK